MSFNIAGEIFNAAKNTTVAKNTQTKLAKGVAVTLKTKVYSVNDVKYLTNQGMTKEEAYEYLDKTSNYVSPGKNVGDVQKYPDVRDVKFDENDIKYLMNNGYTEQQAKEYLVKTDKYANQKGTAWRSIVRETSSNLVKRVLDTELAKKVKYYTDKYGTDMSKLTEEQKEEIRNMIVADFSARLENSTMIKNAVNKVNDQLTNLIDKTAIGMLNQQTTQAINILDSAGKKYDDLAAKIGANENGIMDKDKFSLKIAEQVKSVMNVGGALNDVTNVAGKIDAALGDIGMDINLQGTCLKEINRVQKDVTKQVTETVMPEVEKTMKEVAKVNQMVQSAKNFVKSRQEMVQKQLQEWKDKAKEEIKKQEKRLLNNALKSLTKNLSVKFNF